MTKCNCGKVETHTPVGGVEPFVPDKTLTLVREIGFDTVMTCGGATTEQIFFCGPHLMEGKERGAHATEEAIKEFVSYWENQIGVAKDYLANGRNNKTHEWKKELK